MSANFNPELEGYSGVRPFRFWCQKVLPLVYDNSLSYYELLCKVVDYINNLISDVSNAETNISNLNDAFIELQNYVNEYFDSLNVQQMIDDKLDEMAQNGELGRILTEYSHIAVTPYMFGAVGDGVADDKAALQACLDSGSDVLIADGTFAVTITTAYGDGMTVKSNNHITFANATIKLLASASAAYQIVGIGENVENVVIDGNGKIVGDRADHMGSTGEWGMGVNIYKAKNIRVSGLTVSECWGDGFYLSGSDNVSVRDCVSDHNRRNAYTVISGENYLIDGCEAMNTAGTNPQAGFSFESNTTADGMVNVILRNCYSHDNTGSPLYITCRADVNSVTVEGGEFVGIRPSTTFLTGGGIVKYSGCLLKVGTSEMIDVGIVPEGSSVIYDGVTFEGGSSIIRHDGGSGAVLKGLIVKNCVSVNANLSRLGTWLRYGDESVSGNVLEMTMINPIVSGYTSRIFLDAGNTVKLHCPKGFIMDGTRLPAAPFDNIKLSPATANQAVIRATDVYGFNENAYTYITNVSGSLRAVVESVGGNFHFQDGSSQNYMNVEAGVSVKVIRIGTTIYVSTP